MTSLSPTYNQTQQSKADPKGLFCARGWIEMMIKLLEQLCIARTFVYLITYTTLQKFTTRKGTITLTKDQAKIQSQKKHDTEISYTSHEDTVVYY